MCTLVKMPAQVRRAAASPELMPPPFRGLEQHKELGVRGSREFMGEDVVRSPGSRNGNNRNFVADRA